MDISILPVYSHIARRSALAHGERVLAPWTTKAARDGNPILPDEVYRVLNEECAKHPGPAKHDTFGIVLNATAWRTRHLGMGLSRKTGGQRVDSPVGEIAEDIICHTSGHHWDVLGSAAVGNALYPGQGPSIGIIDLRARPWVAPVEPTGVLVPPAPVPEPPPASSPVVPAPPPPPTHSCRFKACECSSSDINGVYETLTKLIREQVEFRQRVEDLFGSAAVDRNDLRMAIERVSQELANKPVTSCRLRW
jgi:hypothetical protein